MGRQSAPMAGAAAHWFAQVACYQAAPHTQMCSPGASAPESLQTLLDLFTGQCWWGLPAVWTHWALAHGPCLRAQKSGWN